MTLLFNVYFLNFLHYQYLYFYLVCEYLDMKLKNLNEKLIQTIKRKRQLEIEKILRTFNAIYCELKE